MILNDLQSECVVNDIILRIDQSVDYKNPIDQKTSIGRIKGFKYAGIFNGVNKESIWMQVEDKEDGKKNWISVKLWSEQFNKPKPTKKNDSKEPEGDPEYPF